MLETPNAKIRLPSRKRNYLLICVCGRIAREGGRLRVDRALRWGKTRNEKNKTQLYGVLKLPNKKSFSSLPKGCLSLKSRERVNEGRGGHDLLARSRRMQCKSGHGEREIRRETITLTRTAGFWIEWKVSTKRITHRLRRRLVILENEAL